MAATPPNQGDQNANLGALGSYMNPQANPNQSFNQNQFYNQQMNVYGNHNQGKNRKTFFYFDLKQIFIWGRFAPSPE